MADQAVDNVDMEASKLVPDEVADVSGATGKRTADDEASEPATKRLKTDSEAPKASETEGEGSAEGAVKVDEAFENPEEGGELEGGDGEQTLKEPVRLGPKEFYSSTVTYNYFRDLVKFWGREVDINEYEHMVLLDLLKKGHSDPESKIGPGVKAFQVRNHPEFGNPCFFIIRTDGSVEDFSYRKCMDKLLPPVPESVLSHRSERENGGGGRGGGGRGNNRGGGRGGGGRGGGFRGGRGGGGGGGRGRGRGRGRGGRGRF